jgi:hypothetical protein
MPAVKLDSSLPEQTIVLQEKLSASKAVDPDPGKPKRPLKKEKNFRKMSKCFPKLDVFSRVDSVQSKFVPKLSTLNQFLSYVLGSHIMHTYTLPCSYGTINL